MGWQSKELLDCDLRIDVSEVGFNVTLTCGHCIVDGTLTNSDFGFLNNKGFFFFGDQKFGTPDQL